MLGKPTRVILALTAIAPVSVSLAYIFFSHGQNLIYVAICLLICLGLGFYSRWVIVRAAKKFQRLPITIQKSKSADKEVLGFFVAYALPLIFRGDAAPDIGAWIIAGFMLVLVLWTTHALQVNPVLGVIGFHFYEVETKEGITYLLITRKAINNLKNINSVVQITEYGILDSSIKD
ncbi:hypothetical protein [Pseudomonas syringae]|uniref:hypothetical protein n=1 Tax=Pseudomonas syringae TaxID=317 RepID=UPI001F0D35DE|nr:hypothetical protein [Pseudomonas syringae]MCH5555732.1 hypothetical protein [Pseudomonas syringae pv. syringae]MCH5576284.1 hypothetical protein [Pseudomonas syringae pv. syringae]MCH5668499.1 hypothetical protein [Pseudomonas syringae pv. syringae]